jgi:hypothetical protein
VQLAKSTDSVKRVGGWLKRQLRVPGVASSITGRQSQRELWGGADLYRQTRRHRKNHGEWARQDSNLRPGDYESLALTN